MNDGPGYVPRAGWYVDPKTSLHLRWWSGLEWTEHIAPLPDVARAPLHSSRLSPPTTGQVTAVAAPLPPPVPRIAPVSNYSWDREAGGAPAHANQAAAEFERVDEYRNIPSRWSTASVWLLAFTPWLVGVSALFVDLRFRGFPSYAAIALPFLITLAWAQRDVTRLRLWGHQTVAHWAWSLLGAPFYLVARTVVLRRTTGIGSAPLWAWLVNLLAVVGTGVILALALASLYLPHLLDTVEQRIASDVASAGYTVACPRTIDSPSFTCQATDATGSTQPVLVELTGLDGSFTYSVPAQGAGQS